MPDQFETPESVMRRAIELATRGLGTVEPNPAVGAVLVDDQLNLLACGFHERFGGPHAEIRALHAFLYAHPDPSERHHLLQTATLFVTLEPCCHFGKTPPCTQALINAGVRRVVVGIRDPFPHVNGGGLQQLREAGIDVTVGLLEDEVRRLNAPFLKMMTTGVPYVHAKWAMTLDGKLATRTGDSKWISNEASRTVVHQLRGRMDAIVIGAGTARADNPLLTARPAGPRTATRIVLDSQAALAVDSQLVCTTAAAPVMVVTSALAPPANIARLQQAGVEVLMLDSDDPTEAVGVHPSISKLLAELGRRRMTNVLIEGGAQVFGALWDAKLVDELHVFVAARVVGGSEAPSPVAGIGSSLMSQALQLNSVRIQVLDSDVYIHGTIGH